MSELCARESDGKGDSEEQVGIFRAGAGAPRGILYLDPVEYQWALLDAPVYRGGVRQWQVGRYYPVGSMHNLWDVGSLHIGGDKGYFGEAIPDLQIGIN